MLARTNYSSEHIVADKGEQIYQDLYQDEYETKFAGHYVVIEVLTKRAYVAGSAAGVVIKAKTADPNGLFHLIKIPGSTPNGIKFYFRKWLDCACRLGDKLS